MDLSPWNLFANSVHSVLNSPSSLLLTIWVEAKCNEARICECKSEECPSRVSLIPIVFLCIAELGFRAVSNVIWKCMNFDSLSNSNNGIFHLQINRIEYPDLDDIHNMFEITAYDIVYIIHCDYTIHYLFRSNTFPF